MKYKVILLVNLGLMVRLPKRGWKNYEEYNVVKRFESYKKAQQYINKLIKMNNGRIC